MGGKLGHLLIAGASVLSVSVVVHHTVPGLAAPLDPMIDSWDYFGNGDSVLTIGVPGRDQVGAEAAGGIDLVRPDGIQNERRIQQSSPVSTDPADIGDLFGFVVASGDFNGDGYADLASGVPSEDLQRSGVNLWEAGAVQVFFGSDNGLQVNLGAPTQFLHRGTPAVGGTAHSYERFGESVAAGDFNDDGYADLAIGAAFAEQSGVRDAGNIDVLYGSPNGLGLGPKSTQRWHSGMLPHSPGQSTGPILPSGYVGMMVAAGDIDGDGSDELITRIQRTDDTWNVIVVFGSTAGLSTVKRPQWVVPGFDGMPASAGTGSDLGEDLIVADTNGDGYGDLVMGAPGETVSGEAEAGAAHVIFGAGGGLSSYDPSWAGPTHQHWHQNSPSIEGGAEAGDRFGGALAGGRLNNDGYDDVAFGVPGEAIGTTPNAGAINVVYGSANGLHESAVRPDQIWSQGPLVGAVEPFDVFGAPMTTADVNGDGYDELIVASTSEDVNILHDGLPDPYRGDHGSVHVVYGSAAGTTSARNLQIYPGNGANLSGDWLDAFGAGLDGQPMFRLFHRRWHGGPSVVRSLQVQPGVERLDVTWRDPVDHGGTPLEYEVAWRRSSQGSGSNQTRVIDGTSTAIAGLDPDVEYVVEVTAINLQGARSVVSSATATARAVPLLTAINPARFLETRVGPKSVTFDRKFEGIGRRPGGSVTEVQVGGRGDVPANAESAMVNLTVAAPLASGYATVFPCGGDVPNVSNVNYGPGEVAPNAALVALGDDGKVCIFTLAAAHLILDVNGIVEAEGSPETFAPVRIYESRIGPQNKTFDGKQQGTGRRKAGSVTEIDIGWRVSQADLGAAFMNVTAVNPSASGFLTVYDCTSKVPLASHVNYGPGDVAPNAVFAPVADPGSTNKVCVYTVAETDLIVDLGGAVPQGLQPIARTPARILESRTGPNNKTVDGKFQGDGRLTAGKVLELQVTGRAGVPGSAQSVMMNLTAIAPSAAGFLTVYPCGSTRPLTSNVNYGPGDIAPNAVLAKIGVGGKVCIYTLAATDLIADVSASVNP